MALVAFFALLTSGMRLVPIARGYLPIASFHANLEQTYLSQAALLDAYAVRLMPDRVGVDLWKGQSESISKYAAKYREAAAFHALLKRKYSTAAYRPWEPLPPDPPPPQLPLF
jgi:hypothetical protein